MCVSSRSKEEACVPVPSGHGAPRKRSLAFSFYLHKSREGLRVRCLSWIEMMKAICYVVESRVVSATPCHCHIPWHGLE